MVLPYSGAKGENFIKSIEIALKRKLPEIIVTKSAYSATRSKDEFNIKTKSVKEHQHGITYYTECPEEN